MHMCNVWIVRVHAYRQLCPDDVQSGCFPTNSASAWLGRWVGVVAAPADTCRKRGILLQDNASACSFSFPGRWTVMWKCSAIKKSHLRRCIISLSLLKPLLRTSTIGMLSHLINFFNHSFPYLCTTAALEGAISGQYAMTCFCILTPLYPLSSPQL